MSQTDGSIGPETSLFDSVFYMPFILLCAAAAAWDGKSCDSSRRSSRSDGVGVTENAIRVDGAIKNGIVFNPPAHPSHGLWTICWKDLGICSRDGRSARRFPLRETTKAIRGNAWQQSFSIVRYKRFHAVYVVELRRPYWVLACPFDCWRHFWNMSHRYRLRI